MSALAYRNRLGDWVELSRVPATECKNAFGQVMDLVAGRGAVAITRHDTPKAVLLSLDEFQALVEGREPSLEALSAELDGLLAGMQRREARAARAAAFAAAPEAVGRAAVKAAGAVARPARKKVRAGA